VPTADIKKIKYEELREALIAEYKINGRKSLRFTAKDKKPYLSNLPPLDKFFAGWRAISIGPDAIRKFVLERQAAGCSNASINNLNPGETKNDEARIIPLNKETVQILKMLPRDQEFVFGQQLGQFRKSWRNACVRSELGKFEKLENGAVVYTGLTFHDLRRSGVRNLIRAGVSEQVAMKISGHKTTSIFRRYNIISGADLRNAAKKLDSYVKREEGRFDESLMEVGNVQ